MNYFHFYSPSSGRSKVKDFAYGVGTLIDIGGTKFRPSEVLPKYNPNDPFADDLAALGSDFKKVILTPKKLEVSWK